jgi:hypothetical protein
MNSSTCEPFEGEFQTTSDSREEEESAEWANCRNGIHRKFAKGMIDCREDEN